MSKLSSSARPRPPRAGTTPAAEAGGGSGARYPGPRGARGRDRWSAPRAPRGGREPRARGGWRGLRIHPGRWFLSAPGAARVPDPLPPRPCDESCPQSEDGRANRRPQGPAPRRADTTTAPWTDSHGVLEPPLASAAQRGLQRPSSAASLLAAPSFLLIAPASRRLPRPYRDREALTLQVTERLWHLAPDPSRGSRSPAWRRGPSGPRGSACSSSGRMDRGPAEAPERPRRRTGRTRSGSPDRGWGR